MLLKNCLSAKKHVAAEKSLMSIIWFWQWDPSGQLLSSNTILSKFLYLFLSNFTTTCFLVRSSYLYTIIIFIFRRWGGWRLHLHVIADRALSLPLGILLSNVSSALNLNLLTAIGREKRREKSLKFTEKSNGRPLLVNSITCYTAWIQ